MTNTYPIGTRLVESVLVSIPAYGEYHLKQRVIVVERPATGKTELVWVANADENWQPQSCVCSMGVYSHTLHQYSEHTHASHPHGADPAMLTVWKSRRDQESESHARCVNIILDETNERKSFYAAPLDGQQDVSK